MCGGPWGSEGIVSTAGPLPGFIGILVIALFWGFPLALVTAELSSVYPDDGGYSIWVAEAFGEFWGFQESYWSWASGVIDNAVYPVLAFETLKQLFIPDSSSFEENALAPLLFFMGKASLALIFSLPVLLTVKEIGSGLGFLALFVALPFLFLTLNSFILKPLRSVQISDQVDQDVAPNLSYLFQADEVISLGKVMDLVAILYWNFSGLDCVSTCAGEVKNPSRSYKLGLSLAILLIVLTYFLPLSAAVVSVDEAGEWKSWEEGSFVDIGVSQLGYSFGVWVVIASFVGNAGMHTAEMFEDAWQLCGMAEAGLAPKFFARRHPTFHTPHLSICFSLFIIICLMCFDFTRIINISNFFSVASALLEMVAFLSLRLRTMTQQTWQQDEVDVYRVPARTYVGLFCFLFFPFSLGAFVAMSSLTESVSTALTDLVALVIGVLLYLYMKRQGSISYNRAKEKEVNGHHA